MADDTIPGDKNTGTGNFPIGGAVVHGEFSGKDEPMTDKQAAILRDLCEKKNEAFDGNMTREQADARIAALSDD
ncbi:hypothetical protein PARPLA_01169 [Rhodobacteraceae bacterium THAF1]|uniref:DUF3072 domain-containing protein n=1 Tax=Palleronia sp. THAF1 TaxID=2587842 RepID=UPI000F3C7FEE|nr:DUF3072 domain-containing protein [Palleronia sp. THAF1]QFU07308.1 hypothetical protein FIU81_01335 [Palleronia sp. THAF1]VDC20780.1 hypothetical protein PARPLA_01169 [Rhodobacteraceae bacterium THAF1]